MGLLHFRPPVRTAAALLVCDLLLHPFPRVRKTTAERLYVRLLTLDEEMWRGEGGAGAGGDGVNVDAAQAVLTEAPWDADAAMGDGVLLAARDSLYARLGLAGDGGALPAVRSGVGEGATMWTRRTGGASVGGGAGGGGAGGGAAAAAAEDYGDLVREMGY
jgi:hypothetical protein